MKTYVCHDCESYFAYYLSHDGCCSVEINLIACSFCLSVNVEEISISEVQAYIDVGYTLPA